jgi:hypothetical protein
MRRTARKRVGTRSPVMEGDNVVLFASVSGIHNCLGQMALWRSPSQRDVYPPRSLEMVDTEVDEVRADHIERAWSCHACSGTKHSQGCASRPTEAGVMQ